MFASRGIVLLPFFLLSVNAWGKKDFYSVVNIEKVQDISKLSSKDFHEANMGRVLFNFGSGITKEDVAKLPLNDLQYTGKVEVSVKAQPLNVIFDPCLADVLVLSSDNSRSKKFFGRKRNSYNEDKSFTAEHPRIPWDHDTEDPKFQLYTDTTPISGHLVYDRIKIGNRIVAQGQWLLGVVNSGNIFGDASGVVGIGRMSNSFFYRTNTVTTGSQKDLATVKAAPSFVEVLKRHGATKIGIHLTKTKKSKKVAEGKEVGQVIFGAEKEGGRYKGKIAWIPQPETTGQYWRIVLSEIKIVRKPDLGSKLGKGAGETISLKPDEARAIPDPGTSVIAGPPELIKLINDKLFAGMELFKSDSTLGTVEFDCQYITELPNVVFLISNKEYVLEPQTYVRKLSSTCATGFMGVAKLQSLVLGDIFFQKYYVVFDNAKNLIGLADSKWK